MDVGVYPYPHGDPLLIDKIVNEFLSQGRFDKLRKECMSDADTKPAYQNLQQRVENTVTQFLKKQVWRPDLNKNQLRDSLRKHILESKFFDAGINRIVDQVVNPNVLATVFLPEVEEVVYNYLSIPIPFDKNQRRGASDDRIRPPGREYEYKTSQENQRFEKYGKDRTEAGGVHKRENHVGNEDSKSSDALEKKLQKDYEVSQEFIKTEPAEDKGRLEERIKAEPEEQNTVEMSIEKMEIVSDESQESLNRMAVEGLHINEPEGPPLPDSDDSVPLEINEKSMSESRDSEDSIMNQMSPISQGRLTPDLEEELPEEMSEVKAEEKPPAEEKKPLTFIGRIPKIKREDSDSSKSSKTKEDTPKKEKLDVKNVYSSDESDSSRSYGKSDSDEKKRKSEKTNKEERKREDSEKIQDKKRESSKDGKRERSRDRHKDHRRERSRERHKKSSSSSSSSQRERSSSHHKSSHRHKDSKSRRKEEEKKKSKGTDDHGKERNKKEDRRSTDRDSNERERGRSSGSRAEGDNKKREKEQHKTEESRGEGNQKEEAAVEKEGERVPRSEEAPQEGALSVAGQTSELSPAGDSSAPGLDFNELFRAGVLSRLEFPRLTDDFYVKFNSTGFKYFEDWEKAKLDCEEEFKEFVDEAENNLSLLSDDESDLEFESNFAEENRRTIEDLKRGLGNFRRSLMFDPTTAVFYRWTNNKSYQKFRTRGEKRDGRSTDKNESDESIKENIDRGKRNAALHLKLINKYRRKAMRMGRSKRRQRRPESRGIKEKNENRGSFAKGFFSGGPESETFLASRNLVQCENTSVPNSVNSLNIFENQTVRLPDSPEENEEWSDRRGDQRRMADAQPPREPKLSQNLPLNLPPNLPPSPDSDDINSGVPSKNLPVPRKRANQDEGRIPKKQTRRNYSQKYDSQDLYKPRPILNKSRTRGRERGLEREVVTVGSPPSR